MDITLSNIIKSSGYFRSQYDTQDVNFDHTTHKFIPNADPDTTPEQRKIIARAVIDMLNAAKFRYDGAAFEKLERAKGPNYWAFVVRVPAVVTERALDRDIHGNLIYVRTQRRVPNT